MKELGDKSEIVDRCMTSFSPRSQSKAHLRLQLTTTLPPGVYITLQPNPHQDGWRKTKFSENHLSTPGTNI